MRKLLLSLACLAFIGGIVIAAETVTLKSYKADTKEVVVTGKDGKEATYKITDTTKFTRVDKDGVKTEGKVKQLENVLSNEKLAGKAKLEITTEGGKLTEIITKSKK